MMKDKIVTADEAVALIRDGDSVSCSGFVGIGTPEELIAALERRYIHSHRWCDAEDIAALVASGQAVYPMQLGGLLPEANALADARTAPELREPQPIR